MVWYKSWRETRSRFLIGLALLLVMSVGTVVTYPQVQQLLPLARSMSPGDGLLGRAIRESVEVESTYQGFVWWQWFRQNLSQTWTLFAVLIGTGGLLAQAASGEALFTLSLPISRRRLLGVRAATGLGELLVLAIVPSLLLPLLSPAIGQHYGLGDTLVHGLSLFVAGAIFYSLAFMLSTVFGDIWRPLLLACAMAFGIALCEAALGGSTYGVFSMMSGESYFRTGQLPWLGLLFSAAASAAMLYAATLNVARHDF